MFFLEKYLFLFLLYNFTCILEKCDLGYLNYISEMSTTPKQRFQWLVIIGFTEISEI